MRNRKSTPLARCGSAGYDSFELLAERWPSHGFAIETTGLFTCPRSAARVRAGLATGRARRVGPRFAQPAARRAVSRPRPLAKGSALDPVAGRVAGARYAAAVLRAAGLFGLGLHQPGRPAAGQRATAKYRRAAGRGLPAARPAGDSELRRLCTL